MENITNNDSNWTPIRVVLPNGDTVIKRVKNIEVFNQFIEHRKQHPNSLEKIEELNKIVSHILELQKSGDINDEVVSEIILQLQNIGMQIKRGISAPFY